MTATNLQQNAGQRHISAKEERKVFYNISTKCSWACYEMHRLLFSDFRSFQLRKPLIERKRRERINHCLDQLRETVVGAFRLDVS